MRATFVPKSHYHKLRGDLQDLKQDNKSVMDYYYELIALKGRVGLEESEDATQDRFIHGLNVNLKHKVHIDAMRGISMDEVFGFTEAFERQGKKVAARKGKMVSNHIPSMTGGSKWSGPPRKVEVPNTSNPPTKTPLKTLPGPQPAKATPQTGDRKVRYFKCKGYGLYARNCVNQQVMVIRHDGYICSEDEEELEEMEMNFAQIPTLGSQVKRSWLRE